MKFSGIIANVQFATRYSYEQAKSKIETLHATGIKNAKAFEVFDSQVSSYWVVALDYFECDDNEVVYVQRLA